MIFLLGKASDQLPGRQLQPGCIVLAFGDDEDNPVAVKQQFVQGDLVTVPVVIHMDAPAPGQCIQSTIAGRLDEGHAGECRNVSNDAGLLCLMFGGSFFLLFGGCC